MSAPFVQGSETSEAAAKSIKTDKGRAAVLAVLRQHPGGLTDEEIQGLTGLSPSTERPRRVELERDRRIYNSGQNRKTKSGRQAVVWMFCSDYGDCPFTPTPTAANWKTRALCAEAACAALRRSIDQLQLELAKAQARSQPSPFFDLWGVPRRGS